MVNEFSQDALRLLTSLSGAVGRTLVGVTAVDAYSERPALVIGLPRGGSRANYYELAQRHMREREVQFDLDSIFLVHDDDRGFKDLASAGAHASAYPDLGIEVSGRVFRSPLRLSVGPRQLEQDVLAALHSVLPDETELDAGEPNSFARPDAVLAYRNVRVVVAVLVTSSRNERNRIVEAFGEYAISAAENPGYEHRLLIITLGELHSPTWRLESEYVHLVPWNPEDTGQLAAATRHLLGS